MWNFISNIVTYWLDVLWYSMILLGVGEVVVTIVLVSIARKLNALKRLPDNEVLSKKSTGRVTRQFDSDEKLRVCALKSIFTLIVKTLTKFNYICHKYLIKLTVKLNTCNYENAKTPTQFYICHNIHSFMVINCE